MSTQLTRQEQLFGEVDRHYGEVTIPNKDLWPFVRVVSSIVGECRLHSDGDSFSASMVDPANVAMVNVTFEPETSIPWDEPIGIDVEYLNGRLQNKPRTENNSVDVTLDVARPYSTISVSEEINGREYHLSERLGLIDTDSIRPDPDTEFGEFDAEVEVDVKPLYDFIRNKPKDNHLRFVSDGSLVRIGEAGDASDYTAALELEQETGEAETIYSPDYLKDMLKALKAVNVDTVTMQWSSEYPVKIDFETGKLKGDFGMAPRVRN